MANGRRKIKVPRESPNPNEYADIVSRNYPSTECLDGRQFEETRRITRVLSDFLTQSPAPHLATEHIVETLQRSRFQEGTLLNPESVDPNKRNYFFRNVQSPYTSLIAVKEGHLPIDQGFNMIAAHLDSPCLIVKPTPLRIEWDADDKFANLGVRFSCSGYGGVQPQHWLGQQVRMVGYSFDTSGKKVNLEIPGVITEIPAHIADIRERETVGDAFPRERSFEVDTGYASYKEALIDLKFLSRDDLASTRLYVVPKVEPTVLNGANLRLLTGYGLDDSACVVAALEAFRRARPRLTSMLWLTDNEETGDAVPTGLESALAEHTIDFVLRKQLTRDKRRIDDVGKNIMYLKSSFLIGDVTIAPTGRDTRLLEKNSAAKIGFGVHIDANAGAVSSPYFVEQLRALARAGINSGSNVCHHVIGNFYRQDDTDTSMFDPMVSKSGRIKQVGRWADSVGVPCGGAHSHNEIVSPADVYWATRFYRRFFESDLRPKQ